MAQECQQHSWVFSFAGDAEKLGPNDIASFGHGVDQMVVEEGRERDGAGGVLR